MIKAMRKVPAGTFLLPMIVSMLLYSFWPGLFRIGGPSEAFSQVLAQTILSVY